MERLVVLDTNCLLRIISRHSKRYYIWESFLDGDYEIAVTKDILEEYEEILSHKANPVISRMALEIIRQAPNTRLIDARYHWHLIEADVDDNKFSDCAVVCNADFIVTEDKHFSILADIPFPHINVLGLDEFGNMVRNFRSGEGH